MVLINKHKNGLDHVYSMSIINGMLDSLTCRQTKTVGIVTRYYHKLRLYFLPGMTNNDVLSVLLGV